MRKLGLLLCTLLSIGAAATAQTPPAPPPQAPAVPAASTLSTGTRLIVVDVTVQDKDGHAIHGLKASDFKVRERKTDQSIKTFEEHAAPTQVRPVKVPNLPPGTFTDYSPVPDGSSLNILLLDQLNTPLVDQAAVLDQLKKYVRRTNPGANIAILGLNSHLSILQGFTTDPAVLRNAIDHKFKAGASQLLDDPTGSNVPFPSAAIGLSGATGGLSAGTAIANMQQFEADQSSFELRIRTTATLDAFNAIARYLSTFPGRKNLIWFSGSFPIAVFPDEGLEDPLSIAVDNSDSLRVTTGLLDRARVAVYPIDARGTRTQPYFDAANKDMGVISGSAQQLPSANQGAAGEAARTFMEGNVEEHRTMTRIADDTGGHAFFNLNNLADAVAKAVVDGANYYTLTYSPENRKMDGEFRDIRVDVSAPAVPGPLKLSYRHGYFAEDPNNRKTSGISPLVNAKTAPTFNTPQPALKTAMQHAAPSPSEVLFTVRVLPDSTSPENLIARQNRPNPDGKFKGPYRRYDLDFAAVTKDLTLALRPDGLRHGEVEFVTFVYDVNGKLLNSVGNVIKLEITPETYELLKKAGVQYRLQVSVPEQSESLLRMAVHDIPSGKVGVVEIATSDVHRLPPAPAVASVKTPDMPTPKP